MVSKDPSTFTDPSCYTTSHLSFNWTVDFSDSTISGHTTLRMRKVNPGHCSTLTLDVNKLHIESVKVADRLVDWKAIPHTVESLGSKLEISNPTTDDSFDVEIAYRTDPESSALQWLPPEQTADRRLPFMFSQCQAIHARSLFPCQDTPSVKSTFDAVVRVPKDIVALMGAIRVCEPCAHGDGLVEYRFKQDVPIPSYLVTIACGDLASRPIGPRSSVWAEPSVVDKAANEFSETEQMIAAGEQLCGPYVWNRYDILVLPPSFPYGGMENPSLTFVSPTVIAGDRSLVNVIAHEIAHSWTGNLVTNSSWEHFWLNEGHTVYLERLIMERLHGTEMRHLLLAIGYAELLDVCQDLGAQNPLSQLVLNLHGQDPDDSYTRIPYEKGSLFLYFLEQKFGKDKMLAWLRAYVKEFGGRALDTPMWRRFLATQLGPDVESDQVNWDEWLKGFGMPSWKPVFCAEELIGQCERVITLMSSDDIRRALPDLQQLWNQISSIQRELALRRLNERTVVSHESLQAIDSVLHLSEQQNAELRFEWSMMCIRARYSAALPSCLAFLNSQGRMRYTRPLYKALGKWSEIRTTVVDNFNAQRPFMHRTTEMYVRKDLEL